MPRARTSAAGLYNGVLGAALTIGTRSVLGVASSDPSLGCMVADLGAALVPGFGFICNTGGSSGVRPLGVGPSHASFHSGRANGPRFGSHVWRDRQLSAGGRPAGGLGEPLLKRRGSLLPRTRSQAAH